jgi:hypothetical protein
VNVPSPLSPFIAAMHKNLNFYFYFLIFLWKRGESKKIDFLKNQSKAELQKARRTSFGM